MAYHLSKDEKEAVNFLLGNMLPYLLEKSVHMLRARPWMGDRRAYQQFIIETAEMELYSAQKPDKTHVAVIGVYLN